MGFLAVNMDGPALTVLQNLPAEERLRPFLQKRNYGAKAILARPHSVNAIYYNGGSFSVTVGTPPA